MSTTDIKTAFDVAKDRMKKDWDGWTDFDMFQAGYEAATEAAKATGTAGDLAPLPWKPGHYAETFIEWGGGLKRLPEAFAEYGQACAEAAQYTCQRHRDEVKKGGACVWCQLDAARQPTPALPVKTWQERFYDDFSREPTLGDDERASINMESEIADLRAALAATAAQVVPLGLRSVERDTDKRVAFIFYDKQDADRFDADMRAALVATNRSQP